MNRNRFGIQVAVATGLISLFAAPGAVLAQNHLAGSAQAPVMASPGTQPKTDSLPANDFAGLNYSDDQKAAIDRIHRDSELRKETVMKDEKLTPDQKNAMLLGYTRLEYGAIFRVLLPDQQKQVRKKVLARQAADHATQRKQTPQG